MASLGIAPKCVSVVIPTRGTKPAALERAVASALGQSRPPDEVVVVFDGPAAPAHAWGPAVRAVALGAHSGGRPGVVRNGGVAAARGDWLAFLDDDDEWAPTKLAEQLQALAADGSDFCRRSAVRVRTRSRLRARLRPGPVLVSRRDRSSSPSSCASRRSTCSTRSSHGRRARTRP